nr:radial spokehead l [Hymenolepis microstoma]
MHVYFTGNLDTVFKINSSFCAQERHLLRAQIARISASTHISPTDFYQLDNDEKLIENPDYVPILPLNESEISLDDWVHHREFILTQGNTRLAEKIAKSEDDENSEESEAAPPPLRPISEDDDFDDGTPAWSTRLCVGGLRAASFLIASNYWHGAFTIANNSADRGWWNVYVGWGQKYEQRVDARYQVLPHSVADEFEDPDVELQEAIDPTPEEEEEWKTDHAKIIEEDSEKSSSGSNEEESEELETDAEDV